MRFTKNKIDWNGIKNGYHEECPVINDLPYVKSNVKSCGYYINNKKEGIWTFYFTLIDHTKGTIKVNYKDGNQIGSRKVTTNDKIMILFSEGELFEGERLDVKHKKKSFLKKLTSKLLANVRKFL